MAKEFDKAPDSFNSKPINWGKVSTQPGGEYDTYSGDTAAPIDWSSMMQQAEEERKKREEEARKQAEEAAKQQEQQQKQPSSNPIMAFLEKIGGEGGIAEKVMADPARGLAGFAARVPQTLAQGAEFLGDSVENKDSFVGKAARVLPGANVALGAYDTAKEEARKSGIQVDQPSPLSKGLHDFSRQSEAWLQENTQLNREDADNKVLYDVGSGVGSIAQSIGLALVSGGSSLIPSAVTGLQQAGSLYSEAQDKGMERSQAQNVATFGGAIEAGLEKLGLDEFLKPGKTLLRKVITQTFSEGIQEATQQLGENATRKYGGIAPEQDLTENVAYSGALGMVLGGGAGFALTTTQKNQIYDAAMQDGLKPDQAGEIVRRLELAAPQVALALPAPAQEAVLNLGAGSQMPGTMNPDQMVGGANVTVQDSPQFAAITERINQIDAKLAGFKQGGLSTISAQTASTLQKERAALSAQLPTAPAASDLVQVDVNPVSPMVRVDENNNIIPEPAPQPVDASALKANRTTPTELQSSKLDNAKKTEASTIANDYAGELSDFQKQTGGVALIPNEDGSGQIRQSSNPKWYQDFYKENRRAPTKAEMLDIAHDRLVSGEAEQDTNTATVHRYQKLYQEHRDSTPTLSEEVTMPFLKKGGSVPIRDSLLARYKTNLPEINKAYEMILGKNAPKTNVPRSVDAVFRNGAMAYYYNDLVKFTDSTTSVVPGHELTHHIVNTLLSTAEVKQLYNLVNGNALISHHEAQERLSDAFGQYLQNKGMFKDARTGLKGRVGRLVEMFDNLMYRLRSLFGKGRTLRKVFDQWEAGSLKERQKIRPSEARSQFMYSDTDTSLIDKPQKVIENGTLVTSNKPTINKIESPLKKKVKEPTTALEKLDTKIVSGKDLEPTIKEQVKVTLKKADVQLIDKYSAVGKLAKEYERMTGAALPADDNPYINMRLHAGLTEAINQKLEGLGEILQSAPNPKDLERAGVLRRILTDRSGIENPLTQQEAQAAQDELESKMGEKRWQQTQKAIDDVIKYHDQLLTMMKEGGIISQEAYDGIKANNQNYFTKFDVVDYLVDNHQNLAPGKSFNVASQDVIKAQKGTDKSILSPIESTVRQTAKIMDLISRNDTIGKLVALKDVMKDDIVAYDGKATIPSTMEKISYFEDGQKKDYLVPKDIGEAVKRLNKQQVDMITNIARQQAGLFRTGVTGANLGFALISNPIRDVQSLAINSDSMNLAQLPYYWLKGFAQGITKGKTYREFMAAGGGQGGQFRQDAIPSTARDLTDNKAQKAWRTVTSPGKLLGLIPTIESIGNKFELAPRLAEFNAAKRKGASSREAAFKARNVTVDFSKSGEVGQVLNQFVPFLNARAQGTINTLTAFKKHPVRSSLRAGILIALPAILAYMHNMKDYEEEYDSIPDYVKGDNFIIIFGKGRDEEGNLTQVVKIPKGEVGKIVANPIEAFMDALHGKAPLDYAGMVLQLGSNLSPLDFANNGKLALNRTIGGAMPPVVKAMVEHFANYSYYQDRPLVSDSLKKLPKNEQVYDSTTEVARRIGAVTGQSPILIDNSIRNITGGIFTQFTPEGLKRGTVGRIIGAPGNALEQKFYDKYNDVQEQRASASKKINAALGENDEGKADSIAEDYNKYLEEAFKGMDVSGSEKFTEMVEASKLNLTSASKKQRLKNIEKKSGQETGGIKLTGNNNTKKETAAKAKLTSNASSGGSRASSGTKAKKPASIRTASVRAPSGKSGLKATAMKTLKILPFKQLAIRRLTPNKPKKLVA